MKRKKWRIWFSFIYLAIIILWLIWQLLDNNFSGQVIDLVESGFRIMVITLILCTPIISIVLSKYDYPYVDYLESNVSAKPTFRVACSSVFDVPKGFDFSRFKIRIADKLWITYSDDMGLIKVRTKWHPFKQNAIAAAWLTFDANIGKIQLECFPLLGIQHDYVAKNLQKEIEECVNSYDPN